MSLIAVENKGHRIGQRKELNCEAVTSDSVNSMRNSRGSWDDLRRYSVLRQRVLFFIPSHGSINRCSVPSEWA